MLLYGGSGHAKVIRDCLKAAGKEVYFIFDDNPNLKKLDDTPVVGPYSSDFDSSEKIIIAIGDNLIRRKVSSIVQHSFGSAVHPSACISTYSSIEEGTVVMHSAIINAGTKISKHCIINTCAIVEHDCLVEDFVHISPNTTLCGGVKIGEGTHIGAGSTVIPNIKIGKWCIIGAGTTVVKDVPDYSLVVGVPGRVIRNLSINI